MTLTRCAPYHGTLENANFNIWGDSTGVYWIAYGNANRFLQTGDVTQLKFYANNASHVTDFRIMIWTETATDGYFNVKSTSANLASSLATGLNTLDLTDTPISVSEGDYYGVYIKTDSASQTGVIGRYATTSEYEGNCRCGYVISSTNFNWGGATTDLGTINIEFYMEKPDIIFTGDSIISGQTLSYACTNQGFYSPSSQFSKGIPAKFETLSGLTYQNIATSGINYPRISNEFTSWAVAHQPRFILIEGGINNLKADATAATIFAYIQQQILDCQAVSIVPIVCLVFPTKGQLTSTQTTQYNSLNQLIINYRTTNTSFLLVDCREALGTLANGIWTLDTTYSSDGLHLNELGNDVVAQKIYEAYYPYQQAAGFPTGPVVFDGQVLTNASTYEDDAGVICEETVLHSGKIFLMTCSVTAFRPSFTCYTESIYEIRNLRSKIGQKLTLTIDGTNYLKCAIKSFKSKQYAPGKYSYNIAFTQETA